MTNIGGYCGVDWDVIINADTSLKSYISFYNAMMQYFLNLHTTLFSNKTKKINQTCIINTSKLILGEVCLKIWTWLLPNELPSSTALNLLVGSNYCIIEVYKELPIDEITNWLSRNAVDNVLIVPILNDMEPALPEYFLYVYFKNSADACYFKLRWK